MNGIDFDLVLKRPTFEKFIAFTLAEFRNCAKNCCIYQTKKIQIFECVSSKFDSSGFILQQFDATTPKSWIVLRKITYSSTEITKVSFINSLRYLQVESNIDHKLREKITKSNHAITLCTLSDTSRASTHIWVTKRIRRCYVISMENVSTGE